MKSSENMIKAGAVLLAGIALGGLMGVLFAPDKGKRTRRKIRNKRDDMQDMMKVKLHSVFEGMKDKLATTSEKANKFLDIEKALNAKIMKSTLRIQNDCPELSKYIEEMPDNLFGNSDPEITLRNLNAYANSLDDMYKKYIREHKLNAN